MVDQSKEDWGKRCRGIEGGCVPGPLKGDGQPPGPAHVKKEKKVISNNDKQKKGWSVNRYCSR